MIIVTVLVFVALLLLLVLAHEWGHFIAARKAGCKVEEFAFGFPPRLFSIERGGTKYSFNLLPIGGFVKIEGEDMDEENPSPDSFASKSASWRIVILAAGVVMNLLLAVVLLGVQSVIGSPTLVTSENSHLLTAQKTYILEVVEHSPAGEIGLKEFDRIVRMGDVSDPNVDAIQAVITEHAGRDLSFEIERQGQHLSLSAVPRLEYPEDEGPLGVSLASLGLEKAPIWLAPWEGLKKTWLMLVAIISQFVIILQRVFSGEGMGGTLTGPIGIAIYTQEATGMGFSYLLDFAALITINLAIINILPLLALDGGRILFVILEKLIGKKVPGKIESITHTVGFALLILLMIVITFKDIQKYF